MLKKILVGAVSIVCVGNIANAQKHKQWHEYDESEIYSKDSTVKKGTTLVFLSNDPTFDSKEKARIVETFFKVYPKEAKIYNPNTRKRVTIYIDSTYKGVAAAANGLIRISPEWLRKNPEDIDVVTHEAMHIVQAYPRYEPVWVTEGIADYVRATLGVNNKAANWSLPDYKSTQHYTNSYRITARFFVWLDKKVKKSLIVKLNNAMRDNTYTEDFWKKETGKTVDELWAAYGQNPAL